MNWIPITERLPEEDEYEKYLGTDGKDVDIVRYDDGKWMGYSNWEQYHFLTQKKITHWAVLPGPPPPESPPEDNNVYGWKHVWVTKEQAPF